MITKRLFDNYKQKNIYLYTLRSEDIEVGVTDFGAAIQFIRLRTATGVQTVSLGYPTIAARLQSGSYCGATVGRVANRIAGAKFTLNGKEWHISPNENGNCLHGGKEGFDKRLFAAETKGDSLICSLVSPDGDMGFPGTLRFSVQFTLRGRELLIRYTGVSDQTTLFSPTCHAYFNLNGGGDVADTLLKINARKYTPAGDDLLPLGTVESVAQTPLNFMQPKRLIEGYMGLNGKNIDHNFCLDGRHAATAESPRSGVVLNVYTDFPGLQLYVSPVANGGAWSHGFCLEPQYFPNAANIGAFVPPVLEANVSAVHYIKYTFSFPSP